MDDPAPATGGGHIELKGEGKRDEADKMVHVSAAGNGSSDDGLRRPKSSPLLEVTPGRPWRDLGDRIVLFDQDEELETTLTGSGVVVWRLIAPRRQSSEVTDELTALLGEGTHEFDEAMSFIDELVESGILRHG